MSLDGYIAGPAGEYDWIPMDPAFDFTAFMERFDTVLMGRKSYMATRHGEGGDGIMQGMDVHVFSTTLTSEDHPGVKVSRDAEGVVADLKNGEGKEIWLFGGGLLFRSLLEVGLVDAVEVAVVPVLLGEGLPMLPAVSRTHRLRLERSRTYPDSGMVFMEYEIPGAGV